MDPESLFRGDRSLPGCWSSTTTIQPADGIAYDESEWAGAVVVVMSGRLHLEWWSGEQLCCEEGEVLFLTGLNLRQISNPGLTPLVLKSIRRKSGARKPD
jgi:hypothetical protein